MMNIRTIMQTAPVIPVLSVEDPDSAVPLASALVAGGLPVLEITLRTPAALDAVERMVREVSGAIVGVGTVLEPADLRRAEDVGAQFAVSPGLTSRLAEAAALARLPFLPGVMTASEAMAARERGFDALKLFPAHQAGGVSMLKALAGPLPDLLFCPTGGITQATSAEYLALPNVACVGGSWLAPQDALAAADWKRIEQLASLASGQSHAASS